MKSQNYLAVLVFLFLVFACQKETIPTIVDPGVATLASKTAAHTSDTAISDSGQQKLKVFNASQNIAHIH